MAEAGVQVWVRGLGFGCKAMFCDPARCSVQDVIHRYCQDLVRTAEKGKEGKREGLKRGQAMERGKWGASFV